MIFLPYSLANASHRTGSKPSRMQTQSSVISSSAFPIYLSLNNTAFLRLYFFPLHALTLFLISALIHALNTLGFIHIQYETLSH